jgi:hypothetical protein
MMRVLLLLSCLLIVLVSSENKHTRQRRLVLEVPTESEALLQEDAVFWGRMLESYDESMCMSSTLFVCM